MLTTSCEGCCFLKQDTKGKGCALGQMCVERDGVAFAPGYCRMCRGHKWAKRQDSTDFQTLYQKVLVECVLKFDMLLFFDEARNSVADLERTLNSDWYVEYAQKIIITDVTGFGNRQNLALQYIKSRKHPVPTVIDSSVVSESAHQRGETIRRISKQVTAPFFLTIHAGTILNNFDWFAKTIQNLHSRVICWSFPFMSGKTAIVPHRLHYGLFIATPYKALTKSPEIKSFTEQLKKEEIETGMNLSWFCGDCRMISDCETKC